MVWHCTYGGMRKRIAAKASLGTYGSEVFNTVREYDGVQFIPNYHNGKARVIMNNDEGFMILPGMEVKFAGNRVIFKSETFLGGNIGTRFLYECFQILPNRYMF